MSGLIIQLPGTTFTGSGLLKLYRDAIINSGSLFCFDFLDTYCNPYAAGNLTNGAIFTNLVPGAPVATLQVPTSSIVTTDSNGVNFASTAGGPSGINLGTTYDMAASNNAFLATIWFKTSSSQTGAYPGVMGLAGNTGTTCQYAVDTGPTPGQSTTRISSSGGASSATTGIAPTTMQQIALLWTPGMAYGFRNGALISNLTANTTLLAPGLPEAIGATGGAMSAYAPLLARIYRAWKENITVSAAASGLTPLAQATAQIAADYAANSGRFS